MWMMHLISHERKQYDTFLAGGTEPFSGYLKYRFADWFTTSQFAPSLVLVFLAVTLIVCGAVLYALILGEPPAHALWRIFVWASASPAEGEVTPAGRFLGVCVTVCGMVILSLLFGIVSDLFSNKMRHIKAGEMKVVEGGHVLIVGWTDCSRCLIEELSKANSSSGGTTFVVLVGPGSKDEAEDFVRESDLRGSRAIIRSGSQVHVRDLGKVAAESASSIIVLADTNVLPEEADAQTIRTLLTLKARSWPIKGNITVQCASPGNKLMIKNLYRAEVVVVGTIVTKLMAQSSLQPGLADVFSMMLGFDGAEFYIADSTELEGKTFKEVTFCCPDAVVVGIVTPDGECILAPEWNYTIEKGDQVIVLAEDDDTYSFGAEPFFISSKPHSPRRNVSTGLMKMASSISRKANTFRREEEASNILVIGWNSQTPLLLDSLDAIVGLESAMTIYSPTCMDERKAAIHSRCRNESFDALTVRHVQVDVDCCTSRTQLQKIGHEAFGKIFVLAEGENHDKQDERTMVIINQLQAIRSELPDEALQFAFDPVVEMREDSTREHLCMCDLHNVVHSSSIVSQALAAVSDNPMIMGIYTELMTNPELDFTLKPLHQLLPKVEEPAELCFAEAAYMLSKTGRRVLIAWSYEENGRLVWEMNPPDKLKMRPWARTDMMAVLRSIDPE